MNDIKILTENDISHIDCYFNKRKQACVLQNISQLRFNFLIKVYLLFKGIRMRGFFFNF